MYETEHCTECNNTNILYDETKGETVCTTCGLVLDTQNFTPPADRIPKNDPDNPIIYTNSSIGTETESFQRLELDTAEEIKWIVQMLNFPVNVIKNATKYVCKIRHNMKHHNPNKIRFTKNELTTLSIWNALKQLNYPLSYDEYTQKIRPYTGNINLMKAEKRANHFVKNQTHLPDIELATAHIHKIVTQLEQEHIITNNYANILDPYAIQIIHNNQGSITYRRTKIVAAAAILAADNLLAERLHPPTFAQLSNIGTGKLSTLTTALKHSAPPVPKQCAAIKFREYLSQELGLIEN
ncbi:MAG: TFIIB-type zinc ribbon-containing protein [Candidatus Bathyarchaeota archaeon]|nr:TFIIB-type zinc ribbon-containing protein [Candidatus Termiticorpusculum sp.]